MEFKGPWGWPLNVIVIGIAIFNVAGVAGTAYGPIWQFPVILGGSAAPQCHFWGGKKGPNWPPQMWSIMFNLVQPMFNPFGVARTAYGQLWPYLTEKGHFGGFWGPPVPLLGGKKGPNWTPQMWSIMFNLVQPMFNPFGVAGNAYGQIWQFWARKAIKYGQWRPPKVQKGSLNVPLS